MSEGIQNFREERLDILAGTRGADADRAVRLTELGSIVDGHFRARNIAKSAVLSADLSLTTSGAWVNGPWLTLPAGMWIVTGQAQFRNDAALGAQTNVCARLFDDTIEFSTAEITLPAANGESRSLHLSCMLSSKVQRTIRLQAKPATGNANLKMKSTLSPLSAGSETATRLWAVRMGI